MTHRAGPGRWPKIALRRPLRRGRGLHRPPAPLAADAAAAASRESSPGSGPRSRPVCRRRPHQVRQAARRFAIRDRLARESRDRTARAWQIRPARGRRPARAWRSFRRAKRSCRRPCRRQRCRGARRELYIRSRLVLAPLAPDTITGTWIQWRAARRPAEQHVMRQRRTVFFVSDQTGVTAETMGHSLLTQFESLDFRPVTLPFITSLDKAREAVEKIDQAA